MHTKKPYYLAPEGRVQRVYALLREALNKAGMIGIARFVLHNKEHLAALFPAGPALMLATLRWAQEIRSPDAFDLPEEGASADSLKPTELKMAQQLIEQMTSDWEPQQFKDDFTSARRAGMQPPSSNASRASRSRAARTVAGALADHRGAAGRNRQPPRRCCSVQRTTVNRPRVFCVARIARRSQRSPGVVRRHQHRCAWPASAGRQTNAFHCQTTITAPTQSLCPVQQCRSDQARRKDTALSPVACTGAFAQRPEAVDHLAKKADSRGIE